MSPAPVTLKGKIGALHALHEAERVLTKLSDRLWDGSTFGRDATGQTRADVRRAKEQIRHAINALVGVG